MAERPHVAVGGAGPAGLAAAERLAEAGCRVTVLERMPSPGRKFLMAGRGGLNLTHSEPPERFLERYGDSAPWLADALQAFPPAAMIAWAEGLGQPCFVGSSGRVFPRAMKASPLLRAWLGRLAQTEVTLRLRTRITGLDDRLLRLDTPDGPRTLAADAVILAFGGASWARLGSDGAWAALLPPEDLAPFRPANCGFVAAWSDAFRGRFAGTPLKNVALRFEGAGARGDCVVTRAGLEGGAVYALSAPLRDRIERTGTATLRLDLRPDQSAEALAARLSKLRGRESLSNGLRKALALPPVAVALLREGSDGPPPRAPDALAALVKNLPVRLTATAPLDRAISTAGGLRREALDPRFMLRRRPGLFAAGEMLDWEAPTGGYLLQASIATGRAAAEGAMHWLRQHRPDLYPHAP